MAFLSLPLSSRKKKSKGVFDIIVDEVLLSLGKLLRGRLRGAPEFQAPTLTRNSCELLIVPNTYKKPRRFRRKQLTLVFS